MISSGSFVSRQIGNASTPPKVLNSSALPSITGMAPSGPMSPRPSTAVPSLTMATVFLRIVYSKDSSGRSMDRHADAGDAGRVGHRQVVAIAHRRQRDDFDLAALVHLERAVVRLDQLHTGDALGELDDLAGVRLVAAVDDDLVGDGRAMRLEAVDTGDVAADVADLGRQAAEHSRAHCPCARRG